LDAQSCHGRNLKAVGVVQVISGYVNTALERNGRPVVEIDMKSAQWVFLLKAMALSKKYNITEGLVQGIRPHLDEPIQILDYFGEYSSNRALAMTILEQDIYSELVLLSQQSAYSIPANWKAPPEQRSSMKSSSFAKILYSYHTGSSDNSFKGLPPSELKLIEVFKETYEEAHAFIAQCARQSTARKTSGQISPSRSALMKLAQLRLASVRLASVRLASKRLALTRLIPTRQAPIRLAKLRLADG